MKKTTRKISEVVEFTGVSRELIHHYLRMGLLPASKTRARYDEHQVKLLLLVKRLREEHNLPLEIIRSVFTYFEFDPEKLEPLVLADPLSLRLARFVEGHEQQDWFSKPLSVDEVLGSTGISRQRLDEYLDLGMVAPGPDGGYTHFDTNVISLCECGVAEGLPFESFRTIASYVRLGFQLEHDDLFSLNWDGESEVKGMLSKLFLRREIVASFVQNVLQSLVQGHLRRLLTTGVDQRGEATLDQVIYRPSRVFIKRHRIQELLEAGRHDVGRDDATAEVWQAQAELHLHAGQYREATFVLEQALGRWPDRAPLAELLGLALCLAGELVEGRARLEVAVSGDDASNLDCVHLALALFCRMPGEPPASVDELTRIQQLVTAALDAPPPEPPEQPSLDVPMLGGWLLCALPGAFADAERGRDLLVQTHDVLVRPTTEGEAEVPGLRLRQLINTAFLLWDAVRRAGPLEGREAAGANMLQATICTLDPGCAFASRVYMEGG